MRKRSQRQPGGGKPQPGAAPAGDNPTTNPRRLFWFRVIAVIGVPVFLLLACEILLRVAGFGYSPRFFVPRDVEGGRVWTDNPDFGRRFFPPELVRYPRPFTMAEPKEPDTVRVFVMGESAAMGDPDARFGLPRMLEVLLRERYPSRRFEVVNAAMVAINSHAILPIARDCAKRRGNLWVIYMGNNEVIGPFGSASVFGEAAPALPVIRAGLLAKETRLGQGLDALLDLARPQGSRLPEWGGMQMMAQVKVDPMSPGTQRVLRHFERNLHDILETGIRAGVPILLCTVASNLKDCAPFASLHRSGLAPNELEAWERAYKEGISLEEQGDLDQAHAAFENAYRIDEHYADLAYRLAGCKLRLGKTAEAAALFARARDLDALQFRTDSRINQLIRGAADRFQTQRVQLVDIEAVVAQSSPTKIPGDEFFYEHVHLKPEGNYLLAQAIAERARGVLNLPAEAGWLSVEGCLQSLGFREWNRFEALQTIRELFQNPPFTTQINHAQQLRKLEDETARLRLTDKPAQIKRDAQRLAALVAAHPDDPDLRWNFATVLEAAGDNAKAEEQWRALLRLHPHAALPAINLAKLLEGLGRAEEALALYERGLGVHPRYYPARYAAGLLCLRIGRTKEAIGHLELAVRQKPGEVNVRLALARALEQQGKTEKAAEQYREVLRLDPANAEASSHRSL